MDKAACTNVLLPWRPMIQYIYFIESLFLFVVDVERSV